MQRTYKKLKTVRRTVHRRHIVSGGILLLFLMAVLYHTMLVQPKAQSTEPVELVTNGSFETSVNSRVPDGWSWIGMDLDPNEGWKCGAGAFEGQCWFTVDGSSKPGYLTRIIPVAGKTGDFITIRAASKPTDVISDYTGLFTVSYGDTSTDTYTLAFNSGTSASYQVSATTFRATAPYTSIRIVLPYDQSSGRVAYDGVSITKQ